MVDQVFELFDQLGATEEQLDFPVVYGSAINGIAGPDPDELHGDLTYLLDVIVNHVLRQRFQLTDCSRCK